MKSKALKSYFLITVYLTAQMSSVAPAYSQQPPNTAAKTATTNINDGFSIFSLLPDFLNPNSNKSNLGNTQLPFYMLKPPTDAPTALQCSRTDDGGWALPELPDFSDEDKKLYEEVEALGERSRKIRESIFVRTNVKYDYSEIAKLKTEVLALKAKIESRVVRTKRDGSHEVSIVEAYLQVAQSALLLDLLNVGTGSPFLMAKEYGLLIDINTYEMLFSTEYRKLNGISISEQNNKYLIAFSNSSVLALYLRALARSEKAIKNPKESMLMAIKCALGMTHIQKAMHHAELLGEKDLNLDFKDDALLCDGIDLKMAKAVTEWDILALREDTYRQFGYQEIPTVFEKIDNGAKNVIMSQPILGIIMPELIMYSHDTGLILADKKMDKKDLTFTVDKSKESLEKNDASKTSVKSVIDVDTFVKNLISASNAIFQNAEMKILQGVLTPKISEILFPYAHSCGVTEDKIISRHATIVKLDNYYLPLKIKGQLRHFKVRLLSMSEENKVKTVENIIRWARYDSIYASYKLVIDQLRAQTSPEDIDMIFASRGIIDPILEAQTHSEPVKSAITKLAQRIVTKMNTEYATVTGVDKIRIPLIEVASKVSKDIAETLNPKRDPKTLPYKQAAIERSIESRLNSLTGIYKTYLSTIIEKQNYFKQKELWAGVKTRLNKLKEEHGVYCHEAGNMESATKVVTGLVNEKTKAAYHFQKQCRTLTLFAHVTGLEEANRPTRLGDYWTTLEKIYSKSDLADWLKVYKKELEYEAYKGAPLLAGQGLQRSMVGKTMRVFGFDGTPLWKKLNNTNDETEKDHLIKATLSDSLTILKESMKEVMVAKKISDMSTMFKRTQTLKVIFGGTDETKAYVEAIGLKDFDPNNLDQLSLEHGVMTHQQKLHDDEQNLYYRTERIQSEIFTDFISNYMMLGFGFLGAQVLRFGSRFVPQFLGGTTSHFLFDLALWRTSGVMAAHSWTFTWILVAQMGIAQVEKAAFRTELKNIRELYQTETPGLRNALPLMTFQEFTRQRHFAFHMVEELTSVQKWNAFYLILPFLIVKGANVTEIFKGKFRNWRDWKLDNMDAANRLSIENKILKFAEKQKRLLAPDLKRLGVTRISLSEMQERLEHIRRNAKRSSIEMLDEVKLAEESYSRIVYEVGKEVDILLAYPHTLNVYRRGISSQEITLFELEQIQAEYLKMYANWFIIPASGE
jgi:hypothetical protein